MNYPGAIWFLLSFSYLFKISISNLIPSFLYRIYLILSIERLPSLITLILSFSTYITEDSIPRVVCPSSRISRSYSGKSFKTCYAVTGDIWLNKLAEGAAMGEFDLYINSKAILFFGILTPTLPVPAVIFKGIMSLF